jgi:hypothetical protein
MGGMLLDAGKSRCGRKPRRTRRSLAWAKDVVLEDLVRRTRITQAV